MMTASACPVADDLLGLNRRRDHPDRTGHDVRRLCGFARQTASDNPDRPESSREARCRRKSSR